MQEKSRMSRLVWFGLVSFYFFFCLVLFCSVSCPWLHGASSVWRLLYIHIYVYQIPIMLLSMLISSAAAVYILYAYYTYTWDIFFVLLSFHFISYFCKYKTHFQEVWFFVGSFWRFWFGRAFFTHTHLFEF